MLVFLIIGLAAFCPIFVGKIPFAADVVVQLPIYESNPVAHQKFQRHAEMSDTATQIYPWRYIARESLRKGEIPLWNPYMLSGTPFQANGQSALFYPPHWVFHLFPMPIAWTFSLLLKIVLLGTFTYVFAQSIGCSPLASVCAGIVLIFSGFFWCWLPWETVDSALWLPLMCYAVLRIHRTGRGLFLTGFSFAMPVIAGHPETALYVVALATFFAAFLWFDGLRSNGKNSCIPAKQFIILFCASAFIAIGFAAVQLIPTIQWLSLTFHSFEIHWPPFPLKQALALFSRDYSRNPNISGIQIPVTAAYAGALTLIAAPIGWFFSNRRLAMWLILAFFIAFCGIYGIEPIQCFMAHTPILQSAKRELMLLILDFSLALMCAMGLTALERQTHRARRPLLMLAGAALVAAVLFSQMLPNRGKLGHFWRSPGSILVFLLLAFLLVGLRICGRMSGRKFVIGSMALLMLDFGSCVYKCVPFVSRATIYPEAAAYSFLQHQPQPFRTITLGVTSAVNVEQVYGISAAGGYDTFLQRIGGLTLSVTSKEKDSIFFESDLTGRIPNRIIDLLNVKYLIATTYNDSAANLQKHPDRFTQVFRDLNVLIFENHNAVDFGTVVPIDGIEVIEKDDAQLARVTSKDFDPTKHVILSEWDHSPRTHFMISGNRRSRLTDYNRRMNSFSLGIESPHQGILVVSEMHYPGWQVYVDGVKQRLLRANYAFMGVSVPSGKHTVRFVFKPPSFYVGLGITSITLLLALILFIFKSRKCKSVEPAWKAGATD